MLLQELAKSDFVAADNISNGNSYGTAQQQQHQHQHQHQHQQPKTILEAKINSENKKEDDDEGEIGVDVI